MVAGVELLAQAIDSVIMRVQVRHSQSIGLDQYSVCLLDLGFERWFGSTGIWLNFLTYINDLRSLSPLPPLSSPPVWGGGETNEDSCTTTSLSRPNYEMTTMPSIAGDQRPPLAQSPTASWRYSRENGGWVNGQSGPQEVLQCPAAIPHPQANTVSHSCLDPHHQCGRPFQR